MTYRSPTHNSTRTNRRPLHILVLLWMALGHGQHQLILAGDHPSRPASGSRWTDGDPQHTLHNPHLLGGATLLTDGRVLAAGGLDRNTLGLSATPYAELYDPRTNRWTRTNRLKTPRWSLDAVTLRDGRALFAGGASSFTAAPALDTAEVYYPATGQFELTKNNLSVGRHAYGISLLKDGRVLLSGGQTVSNHLGGRGETTVDVFDPTTNEFHRVAPLHEGRSLHAQVTLSDGRVLVVGGAQSSSELYDPALDTWTLVAERLPTTLKDIKAIELHDGRVLVAAGQDTSSGLTTDATWFIDPSSGRLAAGPSMAGFHYSPQGSFSGASDYSAFDLFPAGDPRRGRYVLFAGGEHDPLEGPDVEYHSACVFDASNDHFTDVGPMPYLHDDHTESLLPLNAAGHPEVLLFGGNSSQGTSRFEFILPQ